MTIPIFKKSDILIYAALLLIIASLFVFLRPKTNQLEAIELTLGMDKNFGSISSGNNLTAFKYDVSSGDYLITPGCENIFTVTRQSDFLLITVSVNGGFNTFKILSDGETLMLDADCSLHKDCVHFAPITKGGMSIICVPHSLTITGIGGDENNQYSDPIIG